MQMPELRKLYQSSIRFLLLNKYTIIALFLVYCLIHLYIVSQQDETRVKLSSDCKTIQLCAFKSRLENTNYQGRPLNERQSAPSLVADPVARKEIKGQCPDPSPYLVGKNINSSSLEDEQLTEFEVLVRNRDVHRGGHWRPTRCKALWKIAIIIPFRDRHTHLTRLLDYLIPILQRQLLDFRFIVVQQSGTDLFNKGRIFNAAFLYATSLSVDCVVFHDVDLVPIDDRNLYNCPENPRHLAAWVDTLGFQLLYDHMFGGVTAIKMEQFMKVNGYSNSYWGWGGEDDDLGKRIISKGYSIERPDSVQGAMTMIRHVQREATQPKLVLSLVSNATLRMAKDGLSNPETWRVLQIQILPLYHYLLVNVGKPPVEWFRSTNKTLQNKDGDVYDYSGDEGAISSPPMDTKKTTTSKFENYDYMD